jgi:antitoxin (DNA-binding transcriptional repressor) of toxin-antitoxin stability system
VYFGIVKATLARLRRDKAKVARPAIHGGEKLILTEHGRPGAAIIPFRKIDRRAACQDLIAIGPVEFLPRK